MCCSIAAPRQADLPPSAAPFSHCSHQQWTGTKASDWCDLCRGHLPGVGVSWDALGSSSPPTATSALSCPALSSAPGPSTILACTGGRASSPWAAVSGKPVMCDRGRSRGGCRQGVLLVSTLQLLPALLSSAFLQPGPSSSWPLPPTCCA